ncbi:MAG TPA: SUMF1/EgtB/PvdO family nonheme iron enzyme, partial [Kofleriaceae bacterium]|nr:SUMF1/EgtB/PvdO family nonheme iron enzyme [Kofleriaceae bacterium]
MSAPRTPATTPGSLVGQLVGDRYEVRAALEACPAYVPYLAFDREVEVEVALWHMRDALFPGSAQRQAFIGAVVDLRHLNHPNVRRMFDAGDTGAVLFATAQLDTDDGMLPRPGDGHALGDEELVHYTTSVVAALEAAYEAGYVHGHLVPSDIVHVAGLIKVGGAGLYRDIDPTAARGCFIRAERFIAPEVLSGSAPSPAADVYSLAALLAELASGHCADDVAETLAVLRTRRPALADALRRCLAIAPDRRPPGPERLFHEIATALGIEPTRTEQRPKPAPTPERASLPLPAAPVLPGEPSARAPGLPTRGLRPVGKRGDDWAEPADIETLVEGPWVAAGNAAPPAVAVPAAVTGPPSPAPGHDSGRTILDPRARTPQPASTAPALVRAAAPTPEPVRRAPSAPIKMVSRKAAELRGEGRPVRVAAVDRPEMQPVVRPISTVRPGVHNAPELGRYAPPRKPGPSGVVRRVPTWAWILIAGVIAAGVGLAVYLLVRDHSQSAAPAATPPPKRSRPAPTPVVTVELDAGIVAPCPPAMVLVERSERRYCIDTHEAPGEGRMPEAGLSLAHAEASCRSRDKRLCTGDEWETACRGEGESSWPYASTFLRDRCNVGGTRQDIAAAGSFPACRSAVGAFDMSGNVAEWVAGGAIRGGSASDGGDGRCSRDRRAPGGDR